MRTYFVVTGLSYNPSPASISSGNWATKARLYPYEAELSVAVGLIPAPKKESLKPASFNHLAEIWENRILGVVDHQSFHSAIPLYLKVLFIDLWAILLNSLLTTSKKSNRIG